MNPCTSVMSDSQRKGSNVTVFGSPLLDGWQEGQTGGKMSVPIMRCFSTMRGERTLRELADQRASGKRPWKPQQSFYGHLSVTTWVNRYQKKHSPTHHPDHHPIFISFFHLLRPIASSLFKLCAWQSFCTTSFHVLFGLPLGLEPSTSYSIHFFTQLVSSFRNAWPYHRNLFCCSINIISSIPPYLELCLLP